MGVETGDEEALAFMNKGYGARDIIEQAGRLDGAELYREIQAGNWREESELEKLGELKTLIERLDIPTRFETDGASNLVRVRGDLPEDRERLTGYLEKLAAGADEQALRAYRVNLKQL